MISVKNVTQYTVCSVVRKNSDNATVLSHIKEFSELHDEPQFVTREFWAKRLDRSPRTVYRWEIEIINSSKKFTYLYYDGNKRQGKSKLDLYQRFFLSLIDALKRGLVTGSEMTNQEVIEYLEAKEGSRPRWMNLSRQEFQKWGEQHSQRQAS